MNKNNPDTDEPGHTVPDHIDIGHINQGENNTQKKLTSIKDCIPVLQQLVKESELLAHLSEPDRIALITAARDLGKYGIYINAVDTGWVTDEDPAMLAKLKQDRHDFQPPLDIVDGAARICDPFLYGIRTGKHRCGKFLKDYFPIDW